MSGPFVPGVGAVLSADIAVPDHDRVRRFYARVLATGARPLWREHDLLNDEGVPVIGVGARGDQYAHLPIQWMPHVQVADVAASVQRALARGGRELMHAKDSDGRSQWAVLLDPNGAAFGIIPVVPAESIPSPSGGAEAGATMPVGRIAWLDLTVPAATATRDFYVQVVGWQPQDVEMADGAERYADYNMLGAAGTPVAGVCHARGGNADVPPVWMIYLPVGDLAESLRRVPVEGGTVVKTSQRGDGSYAYAMVEDPVGAFVALVPAA